MYHAYGMESIMKRNFRKITFFFLGAAAIFLAAFHGGLNAQENLGRGRITGKVVNEKKEPLEGAQIVVQSLTALATHLEARTDKKGQFAIAGLGTGMWRLTASKNGYRDTVQKVDVRQLRMNPPIFVVLKDLAAATPEDNSQKEAGDALARGNQLLAEEKYAEARALFEKFVSDNPEAYKVGLQIGMCWLKQGELDKAEAELKLLLDNVLKKSGSYDKDAALAMQALAGLGEVAVKRHDIEAGMKYFRQALEVSPTNELLAYNVAEILFSNQKTDEAIPYYLLAIQIKKDWPKPYNKLGMAYLNKGDFPKALEYLRQFIALEPTGQAAAEAKAIIAAIEKPK
jgi:tetratricopeptide (TPR) repeat protein